MPDLYEKDYRGEKKKREKGTNDALEMLLDTGALGFYQAFLNQVPKEELPHDKATFCRLLKKCDKMAEQWGGLIRGEIDREQWEANIHLTLPFLEFTPGKDMALLQDIAQNAASVLLSPAQDGWVDMHIFIPYFRELPLENFTQAQLEQMARRAAQQTGVGPEELRRFQTYLQSLQEAGWSPTKA